MDSLNNYLTVMAAKEYDFSRYMERVFGKVVPKVFKKAWKRHS